MIRFRSIVIGWSAYAVGMTAVMYAVHPAGMREFDLRSELAWETAIAAVWIAATPLVLLLGRRFPVDRGRRLRSLVVLGAGGLLLPSMLCALHAVVVHLLLGTLSSITADHLLVSFYYNIDTMMLVYAMLLMFHRAMTSVDAAQRAAVRAAQLQELLAQAKLQAMQMQLRPHFLFNTMNAIVTLVRKDPDAAEEMIVRLSGFLRSTIDMAGRDIVTADEEAAFIRSYLAIEQVRFTGRMSAVVDLPEPLRTVRVPFMIVQPLVENAVKHSVSRYSHARRIDVRFREEGPSYVIEVQDDGIPRSMYDAAPMMEGIGLTNVHQRLAAMYGDEARLHILPNEERGITCRLTLPKSERRAS